MDPHPQPGRHQVLTAKLLDERLGRIEGQLTIVEGQLAIILRDLEARQKELQSAYRRGYNAGYSRGSPERNAPVPAPRNPHKSQT